MDIKVLKGDWYEARINLPTRERLLRVVADKTPIMLAGVHNYKKDDIRSKGKEYCHSHFYIYNAHHYLPTNPVELRDKELDIKADDVQRKREEFAQRQEFDAMKAMENNKLAEQRLAIQKEIATMKDDIARERIDQAAQFKAMDIMRG